MKIAVAGGLLLGFLLLGGTLASRAVQASENAPVVPPMEGSAASPSDRPAGDVARPNPPYGLIAPLETAPAPRTH